MEATLQRQLDLLVDHGLEPLLKGAQHGIEKEGLRVTPAGRLAETSHPPGLGAPLTNPTITTDYSEALLELITPVFTAPREAIHYLEELHRFSYDHLGDELIWAGSMPCPIPDGATIPIARYGSSNLGRLKHVYRVGLDHRYGRIMQTIAGIHYNFSLPDEFWRAWQELQANTESLQDFRSSRYFRLICNFRRHSWLLLYLFGASPALDRSFLQGRFHTLQGLHRHSLHMPYATSLRMSDLGYSTKAQAPLHICFNRLSTYIATLEKAIHTPYLPYEEFGVKVNGEYRQLTTAILQIADEYYSDIRPKRVARTGEKPLQALRRGGVEYIEVRNIDLNPFLPAGIDLRQALFLDIFLISCLLLGDDYLPPAECRMIKDNLGRVTTRGREPGLSLTSLNGEASLAEVGQQLLAQLGRTADLLDRLHGTGAYREAVRAQVEKLEESARTPSAQVLVALRETGLEYSEWILQQSLKHKEVFRHSAIDGTVGHQLTEIAKTSWLEQQRLEQADGLDFDTFLRQYLA